MSLFHDLDVPLDQPLQRFSPMSRIRTYSNLLLHPDTLYIRTYTQRYNMHKTNLGASAHHVKDVSKHGS